MVFSEFKSLEFQFNYRHPSTVTLGFVRNKWSYSVQWVIYKDSGT